MINLTNTMARNGELACRSLSEKARRFYCGTDPLTVWEYETDEGEKRYAVQFGKGAPIDYDLTFEALEQEFEELQAEIDGE